MNAFGRIALCGMIAGYDGQPMPMAHPALILTNRLKMQGFIVSEHMESLARGAEGAGHAGGHRQAASPRDRLPRA
jgi:NADPH-dependent curcumin reductase CurA